jgi:DNA-binding transcriptional MerR regulator
MPLSRARDYLSIGEVLEAVRSDFPDISISKIRFLETEGLISPERTKSGYRKFYEPDVERLRYILALQRDHFLPLKVIKDRLKSGVTPLEPRSAPPAPAAARPAPGTKGASTKASETLTGVQMNRAELRKATGLAEQELASLEDFGIVTGHDGVYDENDLLVAKAAKGFFAHGVEARHLRMYKQAVDRETAFIEQIISPVAHRKDPDATKRAGETAHELADLSRTMREAMLRASVQSLF